MIPRPYICGCPPAPLQVTCFRSGTDAAYYSSALVCPSSNVHNSSLLHSVVAQYCYRTQRPRQDLEQKNLSCVMKENSLTDMGKIIFEICFPLCEWWMKNCSIFKWTGSRLSGTLQDWGSKVYGNSVNYMLSMYKKYSTYSKGFPSSFTISKILHCKCS